MIRLNNIFNKGDYYKPQRPRTKRGIRKAHEEYKKEQQLILMMKEFGFYEQP